MGKFKILVQGDADMDSQGNVTTSLSHVLMISNDEIHAVGYNFNNGTVFQSQEEAQEAINKYTSVNNNKFDRCEIIIV
jgi:hypothetical protein